MDLCSGLFCLQGTYVVVTTVRARDRRTQTRARALSSSSRTRGTTRRFFTHAHAPTLAFGAEPAQQSGPAPHRADVDVVRSIAARTACDAAATHAVVAVRRRAAPRFATRFGLTEQFRLIAPTGRLLAHATTNPRSWPAPSEQAATAGPEPASGRRTASVVAAARSGES